MSRVFTRVDRELVELAIDLIASGEPALYALSHAAERLRDEGRKGVRFSHVLQLENTVVNAAANPALRSIGWKDADERVARLRLILEAGL